MCLSLVAISRKNNSVNSILPLPLSCGSAAEVRHVVFGALPGPRHWNGRRTAATAAGKGLDLHGLHQDPLDDRQVPFGDKNLNQSNHNAVKTKKKSFAKRPNHPTGLS